MTFTKQDALTFIIGAGAAVAMRISEALIQLEDNSITDWEAWGVSLGIGIGAALGRYVFTYLPQLLRKG